MIKKIFFLLLTLSASALGQRFMVFGDSHHYSPSAFFEESVLHELSMEAIRQDVDFVFITGDLALYNYSEDANFDSLVSDWKFILDTLYANGIKLYACRGNNDISSNITWQKLFSGIYSLPQNGPEEEKSYTYYLEYDDLLFVSLDVYTQYEKINQEWFDETLAGIKKKYVIAAGHEPAFKLLHSNCLGAYPDERNNFWNSLQQNNGKIYFSAHDHFYDHSIISDSDDNQYNDVHQIIAGTGGGGNHSDSEYNGDNGSWTPLRIYHEESYGYVLVELVEGNLQTTWMRRTEKNTFEDGGDTYSYTLSSASEIKLVSDFILYQNYPNPFNSSTVISFRLPSAVRVSVKIYDILANQTDILTDDEMPAGNHEITWNAVNFSSGVYFCIFKAGEFTDTKKIILLK
jgi:predicted phosphodiesterase